MQPPHVSALYLRRKPHDLAVLSQILLSSRSKAVTPRERPQARQLENVHEEPVAGRSYCSRCGPNIRGHCPQAIRDEGSGFLPTLVFACVGTGLAVLLSVFRPGA